MPINKLESRTFDIDRENYIPLLKGELSLADNGWSIYNDGTAIPVDGTGGLPITPIIDPSLNFTNPLSGDCDLRLTKGSFNLLGQGLAIDFSVQNRHLAKVLQLTFDTELINGTFNTGDIKFYIIANPGTSNIIIEPVNVNLQLGITNQRIKHIASFQTHVSITSYRLCIHIANNLTNNYIVDFANFRIWEPTQSIGSIITEPQSYIATIKSQGTPDPSKGSNILTESGSWHREGKHLILRYNLRIGTAGTAGTGNYFFLLPSGLSIDYTLASGLGGLSGVPVVGSAYVSFSGGQATGSAVLAGSTSTYPNAIQIVLHANGNVVGQNAYSLGNGDMTYGFQATIPIQGWGSSVAMSSDTGDGRVVAAKYRNQPSQTSSATVPLQFTTLEYDTHNVVTVGTVNTSNAWRYTAPVSGYYRITVSSYCNTTATAYFLYRNGVSVGRIADFSNSVVTSGSTTISLNSGDFIDIRCSQSFPAYSDAYISIERISAGSQVIAASETVACHYTSTNGQNINATGDIIYYENRKYDTHGAYDSNTGRFTAPASGRYLIHATGITTGGSFVIGVKKNDSSNTYLNGLISQTAWGSISPGTTTAIIQLNAGEYISIGSYCVGTANPSLSTTEQYNNLFVTRVGI